MAQQPQKSKPAIRYLDGRRLLRGLRAGIERVLHRRDYINKINVFPVPDGDTGTNVAFTLNAILHAPRLASTDVNLLATHTADAAIDGARGNSGAILAQFFQGFSEGLRGLRRLTALQLAEAVKQGADSAREAIAKPKEGTMLSVISDFADALKQATTSGVQDIAALWNSGLEAAQASLQRTPEQLAVLKKAGVVDAGGQAFVDLVQGIAEFIDHGSIKDIKQLRAQDLEETAEVEAHHEASEHRYCTECMISGAHIDRIALKEKIMEMNHSSLVIAGTKNKVRVHVHVNNPGKLVLLCEEFGQVSSQKADDMHRQQGAHATRQPVAIVTDSGADIPDNLMEDLDIHMVPVRVHFGEQSFLDKVTITPMEFYQKLAESEEHPRTSQPPPGDFRRQFEHLASHHDAVISIQLTSKASGTWQAAKSAADRIDSHAVTVFDSRNAGPGEGLLTVLAAEAAHDEANAEEIFALIEKYRPLCKTWAVVPDLASAVRGGRVKPFVKTVADKLRLSPILTVSPAGEVKPGNMLAGKKNLPEKFARFLLKRLDADRTWRFIVSHCNNENGARAVRRMLIDALPMVERADVIPASPALGAHAGTGSVIVGAVPLDG